MEKISILPDHQNIIRQIPLFSGLDETTTKIIVQKSELINYQKDEIIYQENSPPDAFYCLVSGAIKAFSKEQTGKEVVVEYLFRGTYFGIISLLTGSNHSVTTQAISNCLLLKINKSEFEQLIKDVPQLAILLSQSLLRRQKSKDIHQKRIFESCILSVAGVSDDALGRAVYSLNLAVSLQIETKKNILLLDIFSTDSKIKQLCKIFIKDSDLELKDILPERPKINERIIRLVGRIDFLSISLKDSFNVKLMVALLSSLVNDYHFVVINADFGSQPICDFLVHTDTIHLLVNEDTADLEKISLLRDKLKRQDAYIDNKLNLILIQAHPTVSLDVLARIKYFDYKIFATLPVSRQIYFEEQPIILNFPQIEYCRAIRRIVRTIAGVRVGLVLGSGAALGLTHIGVIEVLERENIQIDAVCGSSIGAFFGALWAIGKTSQEIKEITLNYNKFQMLFNMSDFVFPFRGIIRGRRLLNYFEKIFGNKTFFDVKKTLKVVACDVASMKEAVIEDGPIAKAILASVCIPALFEPVQLDNCYFIDGGVLNPLPCDVLLRIGIRKIIAVNVLPSPETISKTYNMQLAANPGRAYLRPNIFRIIVTTLQAMEYKIAQIGAENQADVILHPDVSNIEWYEFYSAKDLIIRGQEEAEKNLSKIKQLVEA